MIIFSVFYYIDFYYQLEYGRIQENSFIQLVLRHVPK